MQETDPTYQYAQKFKNDVISYLNLFLGIYCTAILIMLSMLMSRLFLLTYYS